jgi:hypothetical protein
MKKPFFGQTSVVINEIGLHVDPTKVWVLKDRSIPTNTIDLKSFLGGMHFYWKFIPHYSHIAHPLIQGCN